MPKSKELVVGIAILVCISGCGDTAAAPNSIIPDYKEARSFKNRDEIRAQYPVADWLEYRHNDIGLLFCARDVPAYGNSIISVQGWAFKKHSNQWEEVLTFKMNGVGKIALDVDPKTQILSASGAANNSHLGKVLFIINVTTLV